MTFFIVFFGYIVISSNSILAIMKQNRNGISVFLNGKLLFWKRKITGPKTGKQRGRLGREIERREIEGDRGREMERGRDIDRRLGEMEIKGERDRERDRDGEVEGDNQNRFFFILSKYTC